MELWVRITILSLFSMGAISLYFMSLYNVIALSLGASLLALGLSLLIMEGGCKFWYWWISFGLCFVVTVPMKVYNNKSETINSWLEENLKNSVKYNKLANSYFFISKTDAAAFKLVWGFE